LGAIAAAARAGAAVARVSAAQTLVCMLRAIARGRGSKMGELYRRAARRHADALRGHVGCRELSLPQRACV
jgi:hypothetical protein